MRQRWFQTGWNSVRVSRRRSAPLWGRKNSLRYSWRDNVKKGLPAFTLKPRASPLSLRNGKHEKTVSTFECPHRRATVRSYSRLVTAAQSASTSPPSSTRAFPRHSSTRVPLSRSLFSTLIERLFTAHKMKWISAPETGKPRLPSPFPFSLSLLHAPPFLHAREPLPFPFPSLPFPNKSRNEHSFSPPRLVDTSCSTSRVDPIEWRQRANGVYVRFERLSSLVLGWIIHLNRSRDKNILRIDSNIVFHAGSIRLTGRLITIPIVINTA